MGVTPSPPDPPIYKAFTISPAVSSNTSKPTWATPVIKESTFPQSSLIAELSSLQEKDKSSIADKIARLSGEQRGAVYNVLVDLVGEEVEQEGDGDAGPRLEWSVCEAVRVRDGKRGRTRYVRVFFVRAPVVVKDEEEKKEIVVREGKGKEKEKEERSRSRGKDKAMEKVTVKEVSAEKSRRKSSRELAKSKGKGKESERSEEKKDRRQLTRSRHRKKEPESDDSDDCSCDELSDSTISVRNRNMRRTKPRSLASRFKPTAYGRTEQWEKPVIIPPRFPVRGYPPVPPNEFHIRAAYEAGQRDAMAERMRNTAIDRQSMPPGPSHVISFERLRPGFEDEFRSDGSFSQMGQEAENYVNQRRPPVIQPPYPHHVITDNVPPSYTGSQYTRDSYLQDRHIDRRYMDGIRADAAYDRYGPNNFRRQYAGNDLRGW